MFYPLIKFIHCAINLCLSSFDFIAFTHLVGVFICLFIIKCKVVESTPLIFEPRHEKTSFRGFRPGKTQTGLLSYRD